ncbi:MAG: hypothetical protein ABI791_09310 [Acidobacteriota bacterium]
MLQLPMCNNRMRALDGKRQANLWLIFAARAHSANHRFESLSVDAIDEFRIWAMSLNYVSGVSTVYS